MSAIYKQSTLITRPLGTLAERALVAIMRSDLKVIAARQSAETIEEQNAAREKMRERALAREAARRFQRQSASVSPGSSARRKRNA